jgi:two-component system, sensor histidine kinase and response regulator
MVQSDSFVPGIVKILIAEDNLVNQELICEMLLSVGCQVHVVSNGQQVLDALNRESYDMIFMDCQMPVMDGHEAAYRIRLLQNQMGWGYTPIIGITGHRMRDDYGKNEKAYMDDFLEKPFTFDQLVTTIFCWTGVKLEDGIQEQENLCLPLSIDPDTEYLDLNVLEKISKLDNGSNEFLKKIVDLYLRETPFLISQMHQGIQEKNSEKISQAAHSLKSTSANMGAVIISNICQDLESKSQLKMIDEVAPLIDRIENEYVMVVKVLKCFVDNLDK